MAVLAPLSLSLAWHRRLACRVVGWVSLLLTAAVVAATQSRGALLAMAASLTCVAVLLRPRGVVRAGVTLGAVVFLVEAWLGFPLTAKLSLILDNGLDESRFSVWREAWRSFLGAPWLGQGLYTRVYLSPDGRESMRWAHNLYLDMLAGAGLAGLAALIVLLANGFIRGWHSRRSPDVEARTLNAAGLAALAGFCATALVEVSLLRLWATTTLFLVLGVIARVSLAEADRRMTCAASCT
jgi:O-antigen ligase